MAKGLPSRNKKYGNRTVFFWEGKLHKVLRIIRPANLIEAYRYEDRKEVVLLYTDYVLHGKKAYRRSDVAKLLGISVDTIKKWIKTDDFPDVQYAHVINSPSGRTRSLWYREEDIYAMHDILLNRSQGRPRRDGKITPANNLPSRAELKARIDGTKRLYLETDNGLIPLFEQAKW